MALKEVPNVSFPITCGNYTCSLAAAKEADNELKSYNLQEFYLARKNFDPHGKIATTMPRASEPHQIHMEDF